LTIAGFFDSLATAVFAAVVFNIFPVPAVYYSAGILFLRKNFVLFSVFGVEKRLFLC
jgi:hypothetical protein